MSFCHSRNPSQRGPPGTRTDAVLEAAYLVLNHPQELVRARNSRPAAPPTSLRRTARRSPGHPSIGHQGCFQGIAIGTQQEKTATISRASAIGPGRSSRIPEAVVRGAARVAYGAYRRGVAGRSWAHPSTPSSKAPNHALVLAFQHDIGRMAELASAACRPPISPSTAVRPRRSTPTTADPRRRSNAHLST